MNHSVIKADMQNNVLVLSEYILSEQNIEAEICEN